MLPPHCLGVHAAPPVSPKDLWLEQSSSRDDSSTAPRPACTTPPSKSGPRLVTSSPPRSGLWFSSSSYAATMERARGLTSCDGGEAATSCTRRRAGAAEVGGDAEQPMKCAPPSIRLPESDPAHPPVSPSYRRVSMPTFTAKYTNDSYEMTLARMCISQRVQPMDGKKVREDVVRLEERLRRMDRGLVNPNSPAMQYWDMMTLFAMFFTATVTPYEVCVIWTDSKVSSSPRPTPLRTMGGMSRLESG